MTRRNLGFLCTSPKIDIQLNQNLPSDVDYYTTGNVVDGIIFITVPHGLPLGAIQIHFQGISKIKFHRALQHGRADTQHTFLSLRQPQNEMKIPMPAVTDKGHSYRIPFGFVLPDKLPPRSCKHFTKSKHIEDSHRNLPATLGDRGCQAQTGEFFTDKVCVSYRIQVRISNPLVANSVLSKTKCIRVIPRSAEEPPIETMGNKLYLTYKKRALSNVPFCSRSGWLSIKALQPRSICLTDPKTTAHDSLGTTATVDLEFMGKQAPPKLRTISSTLRVLTIYGATPWENHPNVMCSPSLGNGNREICRDDLPLSKTCIKSVKWEKQKTLSRDDERLRDGFHESDALLQPFKYTSSIVFPITLPDKHNLVPTFHSCFVSRVYLVEIRLSYSQIGALHVPSCISLKVPLQITK
ncbi:unnamed protein product [Penicillium salamii]|uniref:Bul1 C-terminal domain-containing protein n=1 Tax=Penicillium salamii TaxID=1612424 RepID=A0A9W4NLD9_9EURO|nr:unnamed protein product [Penicillium salamii]